MRTHSGDSRSVAAMDPMLPNQAVPKLDELSRNILIEAGALSSPQ